MTEAHTYFLLVWPFSWNIAGFGQNGPEEYKIPTSNSLNKQINSKSKEQPKNNEASTIHRTKASLDDGSSLPVSVGVCWTLYLRWQMTNRNLAVEYNCFYCNNFNTIWNVFIILTDESSAFGSSVGVPQTIPTIKIKETIVKRWTIFFFYYKLVAFWQSSLVSQSSLLNPFQSIDIAYWEMWKL